jgi:PPOX class probable F420-dependent enzyme
MYTVDDAGVVRISITADRAKYKNLVRDPRASLHVTREDFYAYVVLEGEVELSAVAAAPDDAAVEELVALYRAMVGEHDDWDDYRRAMVADRRVVARLTPTRAYGMLP